MLDITLNWQNTLEINTTPDDETTPTWEAIKDGFSNVTISLNEAIFQGSFLGDKGYATSYVTGGQLTFALTGVRAVGDPAQDYIFSDAVQQNWGKARVTQLRLTRNDGTQITCDVTLAKITDGGGDANTVSAVTVEIHVNGKPEITTPPVTPTSAGLIGAALRERVDE